MVAVSVVLPTFNRAATLARAIGSVLNQTHSPTELIVVDDASVDETHHILEQFESDGRVRQIRLPQRRGAAAARNVGIENARCQLIGFHDSDDEWLPLKLAKQVEAFAADDEDLGVVYSDMMRIRNDGNSCYFQAPDVQTGNHVIDPATKQYRVQNIGIQSCMIRRRFLDQAGGFNESYPALEDLELFIRLSQICRFTRLPEALVNYYETEGISSDRQQVALARRKLLRQYGKRMDRAFVASELSEIAEIQRKAASV
jgi:glycosyltransferase involved in cell wall biosynthesis